MKKELDPERTLKHVGKVMEKEGNREEKLKKICEVLNESVDYYDWVGFYLIKKKNGESELELGSFVGEDTEHTNIGIGEGICGQAAEREDTYVAQEVSKESNYLACSPNVKSEIVIPIKKNDKVVGELDIDSHITEPFSQEDRDLLEEVCERVASLFD